MKESKRILKALKTAITVLLLFLPISVSAELHSTHNINNSYNPAEPVMANELAGSSDPVVNTEHWELNLDSGQGSSNITLLKWQNETITSNGSWAYNYQGANVTGPFSDAAVTVSESSISIIASGTATNLSAPPGYQTSPFTLNIRGTAFNGQGNGSFSMTFQTYGWPSSLMGSWAGVRTNGSGITAPIERETSLPCLMLLLTN